MAVLLLIFLCVDESAASERPVFPDGFFESDHHIFGIQSCLGECAHELLEKCFLDLDTSSHGPENFNKYEVMVSVRLQIRVTGVKAKVVGFQFKDALEPVGHGHTRGDQCRMNCIEYRGLEGARLRLANGESDEGHGFSRNIYFLCWCQ